MNEIAKLLGGDDEKSEANQRSNSVNQRQLDEYLNEIDQLGDKVLVEFMVNGAYESCTLSKNASNPELFNLRDRSSTFSVSRSRLGLAVALQNGELRIPEFNVTKSTVLESRLPSSRVRH